MRGADVLGSVHRPFRIEPEGGQVAEYGSESSKWPRFGLRVHCPSIGSQTASGWCGQETADILDHDQSGGEDGNGACNMGPDAGSGAGCEPRPRTCGTHVLAGEAGGQDVDRFDLFPVHGRDVAVVGNVGPLVAKDARGLLSAVLRVVLAVPGDDSTDDGLDAEIQAAVATA